MAFSSGPRGGGSGGSGSSRVGFVSEKQSSTAITVSNSNTQFTDATITPAWQLTLKNSGRAEIVYGTLIEASNGAAVTNVKYSARLRVRASNSRDSGYGNWATVQILPTNDNLIFEDLQNYDNEANIDYTLQGAIPFNLSDLPNSITDNQYLQFMVQYKVSADGSASFGAKNGYIALKSFGVGAGSTDVGPVELGLAEGAGQANKFVKYNAQGTGFAAESLIVNADIATDAVTGAKIADDAIGNEHIEDDAVDTAQIADDAVEAAQIATGAVGSDALASGAVTNAKIGSGAVDSSKLANASVSHAALGTGVIEPDNMKGLTNNSSDALHFVAFNNTGTGFTAIDHSSLADLGDGVVQTRNIADEAVTTAKIDDDAITPDKMAGITTGSGAGGYAIALNSAGTAFESKAFPTGGGGSLDSVAPSDLDGVTGGSGDASKFVKTDSTGNQFEVQSNITGSDIANGAVDTDQIAADAIVPSKVEGIDTGASEQGKLVALDSAGTGFTTVTAQSGGATVTLANITGGPLAASKGGTGLNASSLDDLRDKLGIQAPITDAPIPYNTDVGTQKNNTLHRVNASTASLPTGFGDGIVVRVNNDQWAVNLSDGRQWERTLTDSPGTWVAQTDPTISTANTIAALRALSDTGIAVMTSGNFRPQFTDNDYADKVLVARHDATDGNEEYLIACDRHNFWWAPRPASDATSVSWQWEGISRIPEGLLYSGGETDEEHIPAGSIAVLGGKTGIDGAEYIYLMTLHTLNAGKTTSTYAGYFVDDDASKTIKRFDNSRGYVQGTWSRVKLDNAGIDDNIIGYDSTANEAVFLGIVPAISNLTFPNYTFKTSGNVTAGDVFWNATQRLVRVVHADGDNHLNDIFQSDYEVEIRKDDSNYIRGVFGQPPATPPGVVQAAFRADDLQVVGTINHNDTVSILGHKAVITKTDAILPVNLGLPHGSAEANKAITYNSTGTGFARTTLSSGSLGDGSVTTAKLADDAVTPDKMAGITTGSGAGGYAIALNSAGTAFESKAFPTGGGGGDLTDGSVTTAKLDADAVTNAKLADDAVQTENIADGAVNTDRLAADAVTNAKLADDAVETANIADGAVNTDRLAADAVTNAKLADDAVQTENIADDAITNALIADNAVQTAQLNADAVTGAKIADDAIGSEHIADDAVVAAAIADGAVGTSALADDALTPAKMAGITTGSGAGGYAIALNSAGTAFESKEFPSGSGVDLTDGSVTTAKLDADAVTNAKLADDAVQTENIADNSITNALMADDAIGTAELADGAVDTDRLAADAVTGAKIADDSIGSEHIIDDAVVAAAIASDAVTSDAIADDAVGSAQIADGAVDANRLASNAVTTAKINSGAVTGAKIANGAVDTNQLAADAVTGAKIADDAVDTEHLADDAVEAAAIATGAVGSDALASDAVTEAKLADNAVVPANIKGITAGSGIASKVLAFDGNGTAFTAVDQASGGGSDSGVRVFVEQLGGSAAGIGNFSNIRLAGDTHVAKVIVGDSSNQKIMLTGGVQFRVSSTDSTNWNVTAQCKLQARWKAPAESDFNSWTSVSAFNSSDVFATVSLTGNAQSLTRTTRFQYEFDVSDISSDISDDDQLQFALVLNSTGVPAFGQQISYQSFNVTPDGGSILPTIITAIGGGGGGGSSTPADGSIGTAKLAADAVTNAKIADGAVDLENLASQYSVLDDSYTFQADVSSGVDDGKFGYTDSGSNGQIAFNVKSGDSGAVSQFTTGRHVVLYKDASNYVIGRQTAATQTEAGDSTEGAFSVTELERAGTFADGDSVKLYYGNTSGPQSVLKLDTEGEIVTGYLEPAAMAIPVGSTFGGRVITTNSDASGFFAVESGHVGMVKATLLCKQEIAGSGEISVSSSNTNDTRAVLQTQTGTWTVADRATDWIRFSAGGLCYFGTPAAQPICADFAVLVRWANGSETFQSWVTSNSRVAQVDLGSDRLMVVKLYAGNSAGTAHVDCAVGSGYKFLKLSQLPNGIVDGTRVQFTLGFAFQSPSPNYTARRFFLTGEVLDGGRIYANY